MFCIFQGVFYSYHLSLWPGNAFGRVSVSLCLVWVLTVESLDLETSFLVIRYIFRVTRSRSTIKVKVIRA